MPGTPAGAPKGAEARNRRPDYQSGPSAKLEPN